MYPAIMTKFHGPTDTIGARISATDAVTGKRIYVPYDHALSHEACHRTALNAFCDKRGWTNTDWISGTTATGYVFVKALQ